MASEPFSVRKPQLVFDGAMERFYLDQNPIKTHIFNALNLLFPDGERFFVKSVHDHSADIKDPALLRDMRAFAGQEGQHANQHERFFTVLEQQGYEIDKVLTPFRKLAVWSKRLPRSLRLSITAGAEHYTASLAALVLKQDMLAGCDPTMRSLMMWHALEEIEHKAVAYDVFVGAYPRSYVLRTVGFVLATMLIVGLTAAGLRLFLGQDLRERRLSRAELTAARRALGGAKERRFQASLRRDLMKYFKPGFHPNQQDDSLILAEFTAVIAQRLAVAA
jgi:hypothetical protein